MENREHHAAGARQDSVWRKLIRDPEVSHGAFRLWHYLRDRADVQGNCWPEQRTIEKEMNCKRCSLSGWIVQLVAGTYLRTTRTGQNHHTVYTVLDGNGALYLPFSRGAKKGSTRWSPKGHVVEPNGVPPRGSQMGTVSKPNEVNPRRKETPPPRERWQIEKDIESVEAQIQRNRMDQPIYKDQWGTTRPEGNKPTLEAQQRIVRLKAQKKALEAELDGLT